jgi:hypothetical protein
MEGILTTLAALGAVCDTLGIAVAQLAAVEDPELLNYAFSVASDRAAQLTMADIEAFTDSFGPAARIEIRFGDLTELSIQPGVTQASVDSFVRSAQANPGSYEVTISIDKAVLAEVSGITSSVPQRLFLFGDGLRRALARGLSRFESEVWIDPSAPLRIVVLDTDISLVGPMLAVVSGNAASEGAVSTPSGDGPSNSVLQAREQQVGWDHQWSRGLTPWHFELHGTSSDPGLSEMLHVQLIKLAVLFTCDRARALQTDGASALIRAEYRGREHIAVVPIDETRAVAATDAELDALSRAVSWCYRSPGDDEPHWISDRLPFLQTRVAQILEPHPEADRLPAFVHAMPFILEGVEWQWKAFVEGKVSSYLDQVQQVETAVTDTVASFGDRTSVLVKTLTDSLLAAVAVLIGSFIAAAYKDPFNASLFRIGMRAYAGYVLIFPGLLGLIAARHTLQLSLTGFNARVERFKEIIYPGKVDEVISDRVDNARRGFKTWLVLAAAIYVAVAGCAWIAGDQVPKHLIHSPSNTTAKAVSRAKSVALSPPAQARITPRGGQHAARVPNEKSRRIITTSTAGV